MAPDEELNNEQDNEQDNDEQPKKPAGISWMDDLAPANVGQYITTPIGGHVFPEKSRQAAGLED